MSKNLCRDLFLLLESPVARQHRTILQERLLSLCRLAMNKLYKANQLVPGLPICRAIFARVDRGQLPFLSGRQWFYSLDQSGRQSFDLLLRSSSRSRLPNVGTEIQLFKTKPTSFANHRLKVFGRRKIGNLRKITCEFMLIFWRKRNIGSIQL